MEQLQVSSVIMGAFQNCRNSFYTGSNKISNEIPSEALQNFLIQLQQAYNYQISLKRAQRPKRKLPPVPKFDESEVEYLQRKKVQVLAANQPEINAFAQISTKNVSGFQIEEEKSTKQNSSYEQSPALTQMNQIYEREPESKPSKQAYETQVKSYEKKDTPKFRKIWKCIEELTKKLNINDSDVTVYCEEFLNLVIPHLIEHFNKKPFASIAAAVLIFACYKADYHITTKKIIEASETKETMVVKCFYSIKEILANKEN